MWEASLISLFVYMFWILPSRGHKDEEFRFELAQAIHDSTDSEHERFMLVRIAKFESGFRKNVFKCEIKGDSDKSLGTYQIQPMSLRDKVLACGTLKEQTELALKYIHRSAEQCPKNVGAMSLALYVSGRCDRGEKQAKERWGSDGEETTW